MRSWPGTGSLPERCWLGGLPPCRHGESAERLHAARARRRRWRFGDVGGVVVGRGPPPVSMPVRRGRLARAAGPQPGSLCAARA